jgi:hypothetical protein
MTTEPTKSAINFEHAPDVKERVIATYSDNPVIEFLVQHHACDFAYILMEQLQPSSLSELWEKGDARTVMFLYVKAGNADPHTFFGFTRRLSAFLDEQGEHDAARNLRHRLGEARMVIHSTMEWNKSLISDLTMPERADVHRSKLPSLELNLARRIAYYGMDIVHQVLAGEFNVGLSYTLGDLFRDVVDGNPFGE